VKTTVAISFLLLASCAAAPAAVRPATAEGAPSESKPNRIALYLGQRSFDEDDYAPVEDQFTFGLEFAQEYRDSPVGWEIGLMGSADESSVGGFDVEGSTGEIYGGVRKSFGSERIRPYVGAGVSFINSDFEVVGVGSDDDSSVGAYAHGGVAFEITPSFLLGLDLRGLFGTDIEIAGFQTDADYLQFAIFAGFGF
jgi:opacity protein-like surface antigen